MNHENRKFHLHHIKVHFDFKNKCFQQILIQVKLKNIRTQLYLFRNKYFY